MRFAVLRSVAGATGSAKLYMVLPMPSRADQVCVAEVTGAHRLQVVNKSIKSLSTNFNLVVRGTARGLRRTQARTFLETTRHLSRALRSYRTAPVPRDVPLELSSAR